MKDEDDDAELVHTEKFGLVINILVIDMVPENWFNVCEKEKDGL